MGKLTFPTDIFISPRMRMNRSEILDQFLMRKHNVNSQNAVAAVWAAKNTKYIQSFAAA